MFKVHCVGIFPVNKSLLSVSVHNICSIKIWPMHMNPQDFRYIWRNTFVKLVDNSNTTFDNDNVPNVAIPSFTLAI